MSSYAKIKLDFTFADDTNRGIEISPLNVNSDAVTKFKENVKAFDVASLNGIYISDTGATCTGITGATLVKQTERDIPLHGVD